MILAKVTSFAVFFLFFVLLPEFNPYSLPKRQPEQAIHFPEEDDPRQFILPSIREKVLVGFGPC